MSFTTVCPSCGSALRLADDHAGDEARCGRCGAVFVAAPTDDPPRRPTARLSDRDDDDRGYDDRGYDDRDAFDRGRYDDDRPRRRPRPAPDGSGLAVAALVLGIVALVSWWCPPVGLVTGGAAVVVGGVGLGSRSRPLAVTGIVLGLVGVIFSLGCGVLYGVMVHQENLANDAGPGGNRPPFVRGAD